MKMTLKNVLSFISDISSIRYNIRLTLMGQLATLLQSELAHKEAAGNTPYQTSLKTCHTYKHHSQFFCYIDLQKNRCMRKELKLSDLCLRPKSAATTFNLTSFYPSDARSILSTATHLKHFSFLLSADVKPMSNELVISMPRHVCSHNV